MYIYTYTLKRSGIYIAKYFVVLDDCDMIYEMYVSLCSEMFTSNASGII
jgi:hypothetical protein